MVFPGASGTFTLKEDDGTNQAQPDKSALVATALSLDWTGTPATFTVAPASGNIAALPAARTWTVTFRGVAPAEVTVGVNGSEVDAEIAYDRSTLSLSVTVADVSVSDQITITAPHGLPYAEDPAVEDAFTVLYNAQIRYLTKERANARIRADGAGALNALHTLESTSNDHPRHDFDDSHMPESVIQAIAEPLLRA